MLDDVINKEDYDELEEKTPFNQVILTSEIELKFSTYVDDEDEKTDIVVLSAVDMNGDQVEILYDLDTLTHLISEASSAKQVMLEMNQDIGDVGDYDKI